MGVCGGIVLVRSGGLSGGLWGGAVVGGDCWGFGAFVWAKFIVIGCWGVMAGSRCRVATPYISGD